MPVPPTSAIEFWSGSTLAVAQSTHWAVTRCSPPCGDSVVWARSS